MVIDIHTHTFPDRIAHSAIPALAESAHIEPQTDGTCGDLLRSMKEAGVDCSVILPVATKASQVERINDTSIEMNRIYGKDGLLYLGGMHPLYEDYEKELHRIKEAGLKGIKIHPVYQGKDIDSEKFMDILKCCAELGLVVVTHSGDDIGFPGTVHCSPAMCRHVIDEIPDLRLVLAHMGGWQNWKEAALLLAGYGVYIDTAFSIQPVHRLDDGVWKDGEPEMLTLDEFREMIRLFTPERVIFGTDCPWANQKEYLQMISSFGFSEKELERILCKNAAELLDIPV